MSLIYIPKLIDKSLKKERIIGEHYIIKYKNHTIVVPIEINFKLFNPYNFNLLKQNIREKHMIIVDKIKTKKPIVHIIDHINKSGFNPLVGKTPFNDKPKFPDISNIYNRTNYSIDQVIAICIGKELTDEFLENTSEFIAIISIVASYVGWKITALGYSNNNVLVSKDFKTFLNKL